MLKSRFYGDISPDLAEDIVIKQKLYSYLVRQSDRDPSRLVLTFHDGEAKHAWRTLSSQTKHPILDIYLYLYMSVGAFEV